MPLEIIHETNQLTRIKARHNSKFLIILGCVFSVFFTSLFYLTGVVYQDPLYKDLPAFASVPLVLVSSFNAVAFTSLAILFVKSFGEVSTSKLKNSFEQRKENKNKENAKAIYDRFNQYGQKDYSVQIDEAKQGLENKIGDFLNFFRIKFSVMELKYERSERRRITSDAELVKERELRKLTEEELKKERRLRKKLQQKLDERDQIISKKIQTDSNDEE